MSILARLKIGSAFRFSRDVVGGVSGLFFSLINIFKMPLKGVAPAIGIGLLGLVTFLSEIRKNHQRSGSGASLERFSLAEAHGSSLMMISKLRLHFQQEVNLQHVSTALAEVENHLKQSVEESRTFENTAYKYVYCSTTFLAQVGSHFMECLLIKAYEDSTTFNFDDYSASNFFAAFILLVAIYNGYQKAQEVAIDYDIQHANHQCDGALNLTTYPSP